MPTGGFDRVAEPLLADIVERYNENRVLEQNFLHRASFPPHDYSSCLVAACFSSSPEANPQPPITGS